MDCTEEMGIILQTNIGRQLKTKIIWWKSLSSLLVCINLYLYEMNERIFKVCATVQWRGQVCCGKGGGGRCRGGGVLQWLGCLCDGMLEHTRRQQQWRLLPLDNWPRLHMTERDQSKWPCQHTASKQYIKPDNAFKSALTGMGLTRVEDCVNAFTSLLCQREDNILHF